MMTIDRIPLEVLHKIFSELDKPTLFNATLTCRQWMERLSSSLPSLAYLRIELDSMACSSRISYRSEHDASTALCQCNDHIVNQGIFLQEILHLFRDDLDSVVIEDSLLYKSMNESINDNSIHVILRECTENLKSLEFHLANMAQVRVWTLVLIARFTMLTSIHFNSCEFPAVLTESMFVRMLAPSFNSLETICITNNALISDKFALSVAKQCLKLKELNLNGCFKITALAVIGFCEALAQRQDARPIDLDLRHTSFNAIELSRHLNNPLLNCGPCWKAQSMIINIGFDRPAIVLGNCVRSDLVIVIYVLQ